MRGPSRSGSLCAQPGPGRCARLHTLHTVQLQGLREWSSLQLCPAGSLGEAPSEDWGFTSSMSRLLQEEILSGRFGCIGPWPGDFSKEQTPRHTGTLSCPYLSALLQSSSPGNIPGKLTPSVAHELPPWWRCETQQLCLGS